MMESQNRCRFVLLQKEIGLPFYATCPLSALWTTTDGVVFNARAERNVA